MKILWFTWKDREHPLAGGAEIVHDELATRLAKDGHEVIFIVPGFKGSEAEVSRNGYKVMRVGNAITAYWKAYKLYKSHYKGWADLVIDSYFVFPFFTKFYVKEKHILFVHNLCREIWWYQMLFPGSLIGYLLEPLYILFIRDQKAITISQSTKSDMIRHGFKPENISIIREGIEITPIESLEEAVKDSEPTILSLGSIRSMKRTGDIVKAFELLKTTIPTAMLIVAGAPAGKYGEIVMAMMKNSLVADSIQYVGSVSVEQKKELMRRSHLIAVTSVKEGWGLIVTEANSQGTPAVVYNVDGLRDSVKDGKTGIVAKENTPAGLASAITQLLESTIGYRDLQITGWEWSKELSFEFSYIDFTNLINHYD